jgi:TolB protein
MKIPLRVAAVTTLVLLAVTLPANPANAKTIAFGDVLAYTRIVGNAPTIRIVNVHTSNEYGLTPGSVPAWAPDGQRLAFINTNNRIVIRHADGTATNTGVTAFGITTYTGASMAWSPDSRRIAFTHNGFIWVMNVARPYNAHRISVFNSVSPTWSPDSQRIAYCQYDSTDGSYDIHIMKADGSNDARITTTPFNEFPASWSPDGTAIAYSAVPDPGDPATQGIYLIAPDGTGNHLIVQYQPSPDQVTWSPDSGQIAFAALVAQNTDDGGFVSAIFVADRDGSNLHTVLTNKPYDMVRAAWRPS